MKTIKTTILLPDTIMYRLKKMSSQKRCTISSLVEVALRTLIENDKNLKNETSLPHLPNWDMGQAHVDVSNRDALYDLMES